MFLFARQSLVLLSVLLLFSISLRAEQGVPDVVLTTASNLQTDAQLSDNKKAPVLLFFSMKHCPYCREVEEEFLKPMLRNHDYDNKVIIRKVKLDEVDSLISFNGKEMDIEDFQDLYNVSMVPVVMLVDANGKLLTKEITGIANVHYYSAELDDKIERAQQKLRSLVSN